MHIGMVETTDLDVSRQFNIASRLKRTLRLGKKTHQCYGRGQEDDSPSGVGNLSQNVNRICSSSRRLLALSENTPPPEPAGWLAWPKSGDVMLPIIGPGLLWFVKFRICIEIV